MKLITLAMLVTTIALASSNQAKIENTVKTVEQTYAVKCKFKKETMEKCFGASSSATPAVCYNAKKYVCSNNEEKMKLKFKMRTTYNYQSTERKVYKAVLKVKKEIEQTTLDNTVTNLENNFQMACEFKKETFNKCIGAVDAGIPFSNLEKSTMAYAAVCWYSKKYECTDGQKELKLRVAMRETTTTAKTVVRKIVFDL